MHFLVLKSVTPDSNSRTQGLKSSMANYADSAFCIWYKMMIICSVCSRSLSSTIQKTWQSQTSRVPHVYLSSQHNVLITKMSARQSSGVTNSETSESTVFYKWPTMRHFRFISRIKLYQVSTMVLLLPPICWWYSTDIITGIAISLLYPSPTSHTPLPCHILPSHATYSPPMPHTPLPCHIFPSHITYPPLTSHTSLSHHILPSHATYSPPTSHTPLPRHILSSHVTYLSLTSLLL